MTQSDSQFVVAPQKLEILICLFPSRSDAKEHRYQQGNIRLKLAGDRGRRTILTDIDINQSIPGRSHHPTASDNATAIKGKQKKYRLTSFLDRKNDLSAADDEGRG